MKSDADRPIVSVVGPSGVGKTTVLEKLIPQFNRLGLTVGTVKHDVHGFEIDRPGKDSWRHKQAGAATTLLSSPLQIGMVTDVAEDHNLEQLADLLSHVDIILTEGYMRDNKPKVEVFRPQVHKELLCPKDNNLIAVVSDAPVDQEIPCFATHDPEGLARFLVRYLHLIPPPSDGDRGTAP